MMKYLIFFVAFGMTQSFVVAQQKEPIGAAIRRASWAQHVELKKHSILKAAEWRSVGPSFLGGRIESIAVPKDSPSTFYVGVGSGNLWKTENNGTTWKPIFEEESTFTIGSVAVAPSDPNVVWVGTGEVLMARSSFAGTGVFKSTDAGGSWQHMGLDDTYHIGRVLIHPEDPDIVYIAAIGHNYSFNEERGLFKTVNGGKSWDKVLYVSDRVGVVDVIMDPVNKETLYAISWERDRKAWNNVVSGEGSGIHKSTDGGLTWKRLEGGLPKGKHAGRFGLSISPSNPNVMYALVDNHSPAVAEQVSYKGLATEDLSRMSTEEVLEINSEAVESLLRERGVSRKHTGKSVLASIANHTLAKDKLVQHLRRLEETRASRTRRIGGELYRSENRGNTWSKVNEDPLPTAIGYDFCIVRVSPDNENEIFILGNYLLQSKDGGKTYRRNEGKLVHLLPHESTVLHLDHHDLWIDPENSNRLILGNDGGVHLSYDRGESWLHLNNLPIGEFYAVDVDYGSPYKIYGGTQDDAAVMGPDPWEHIYLDRWGGGDSYFTFPDPEDLDTIYYEHQFGRLRRKNLNDGTTVDIMPEAALGEEPLRYNWMSPFFASRYNHHTIYFGANRLFKSINRGDKWLAISPDLSTNPGPDKQGNVPYGALTALSESFFRQGVLYAGTDDGNVWFSENDGREWILIRNGLPEKWVSRVVASQHVRDRVYVTLTGYRDDDFRAYTYVSPDNGRTWKSIVGNLPNEPVNVIREDNLNPNILYLGTDLGAYVSLNRGESWQALMSNLPTTPVHDLRVQNEARELVAGTHGRSIFVLDVSPIQQLTSEVLEKPFHLMDVTPAQIGRHLPGRGVWEQEPDQDAIIYFFTREAIPIEISIEDREGTIFGSWESISMAGLNKKVWDIREESTDTASVEPGIYQAKLCSSGTCVETPIEVKN